jgi:hypothetical protein
MEFIKITTLEGKSEFIAQNKIIAFHKMELSEKNKIELGEDKATLKIETLENRQFVAIGTEEEIEGIINTLCKDSLDLAEYSLNDRLKAFDQRMVNVENVMGLEFERTDERILTLDKRLNELEKVGKN